MTISESWILMLMGIESLSGGADVSVAVTVTEYVPAIVGTPDSCPERLSDSPGGNTPVSVHVNAPEPPLALKVNPGYESPVVPSGGALAVIDTCAGPPLPPPQAATPAARTSVSQHIAERRSKFLLWRSMAFLLNCEPTEIDRLLSDHSRNRGGLQSTP
jgi:hypothetical protein